VFETAPKIPVPDPVLEPGVAPVPTLDPATCARPGAFCVLEEAAEAGGGLTGSPARCTGTILASPDNLSRLGVWLYIQGGKGCNISFSLCAVGVGNQQSARHHIPKIVN